MLSKSKFFYIFLAMLLLASCKDDSTNPTPENKNQNVITAEVSLNDNANFNVESAYIGKSSSTSSYIYGIVKIKYLGNTDRKFLNVTANFKNTDNQLLFTDNSYLYNITSCMVGAATNTNTFVTPAYNAGYYFLIKDLSDMNTSINDIKKIEMIISGSAFNYAQALGNLAKVDQPYRVESDSWYMNIKNDGDKKIEHGASRFIFKDADNRLFKWTFPHSFIGNTSNDIYEIGQSGKLMSTNNTPDYISSPLGIAEVCLDWDITSVPNGPGKLFEKNKMSVDERNIFLRNMIDNRVNEISRNYLNKNKD